VVDFTPSLPFESDIKLCAIHYSCGFPGASRFHFAALGTPLNNFAVFRVRGGGGPMGLGL